MREFVLVDDAFPAERVVTMRNATLGSSYVGRSPLIGTFQASRGFAVTFRREGLETVAERLPFLMPFIERVLRPRSYRPLWSLWERTINVLADRRPNLFYVNLLLVPPGAGVGHHVDATLRSAIGLPDALPRVVSVLYLQYAAHWKGGLLRLSRDDRRVGDIQPRKCTRVPSRGDLAHEVTPVDLEADEDRVRASLVCEQYCVAEAMAARLPPFSVRSQGRFQYFLDKTKGAPAPNVVLEFPESRSPER